MATNQELQYQLHQMDERRKFAWRMYYNAVRRENTNDHKQYQKIEKILTEVIPTHIKNELKEMALALKTRWECPVCKEFITEETGLEIFNCGHWYCKKCLDVVKEDMKKQGKNEWECGVCRKKHKINE